MREVRRASLHDNACSTFAAGMIGFILLLAAACSTAASGPPVTPVSNPLVDAENYFEHGDYGRAIAIVKALPGYGQSFQDRYNVAVATFDMGDMISAQAELDAAKAMPDANAARLATLQSAIALENARPLATPPVDPGCTNYHGHNTGRLAACVTAAQHSLCYQAATPKPCARLDWLNFI